MKFLIVNLSTVQNFSCFLNYLYLWHQFRLQKFLFRSQRQSAACLLLLHFDGLESISKPEFRKSCLTSILSSYYSMLKVLGKKIIPCLKLLGKSHLPSNSSYHGLHYLHLDNVLNLFSISCRIILLLYINVLDIPDLL